MTTSSAQGNGQGGTAALNVRVWIHPDHRKKGYGNNLLLAVHALHHRRVRVYLHRYRLAVAERENFHVFASFVADSHGGNRHDRIAVSEEAGHLHRHGLLAQPPEHLWCLLL